jgi:catechol 2,3-dioxygenase-like lactoylglutathione lyase family enzyme
MKLHHVAVESSSRERAESFYGGILGMSLVRSIQLDGELAERIFDIPDECEVLLFQNEHFAVEVFVTGGQSRKAGPYAHLCLEVDDKKRCADDCDARGLGVRRIPRGDDFLIFVRDFDGNLFEIKETPKT